MAKNVSKTVGIEFATKVSKWAQESADLIEAVRKESIKRVAQIAADGVPVKTGFAKASMEASLDSMPEIDPTKVNESGRKRKFDFVKIERVVDRAKVGQTVYIGWTAAYILALEYGHSQQAPSGFARLAAAQWPVVVKQVASEMRRGR